MTRRCLCSIWERALVRTYGISQIICRARSAGLPSTVTPLFWGSFQNACRHGVQSEGTTPGPNADDASCGASISTVTSRRDGPDLGTLDDYRIFAGRHLVTASALLDLVSESWLLALATHCRAAGAVVLFAITYNGRFTCAPAEDEDDTVRELMNRHQLTDKGLGGPAAGPAAAACAEQFFAGVGYTVRRERSDWTLGPAENDVQRLLIEGFSQAATEMSPERAAIIERWRARRLVPCGCGPLRNRSGP